MLPVTISLLMVYVSVKLESMDLLVGYTSSEVPAGFIEEGIAGAYNAYTINQLDQTQDRSLFDSFVQEGIQGSLIRAFGINPA